jgi:single-stranded-DNA-specific exonuclease
MAAGVTLPPDGLAPFTAFVEESLAANAFVGAASILTVDAALTAGAAQPDLVEMLEQAGPFGNGNPEPVFAFPSHRLVEVMEVGNGAGHLRLRLKSGDGSTLGGMAFRAAGQPLGAALLAARGELVHAAGTLSVDRWGGTERARLRLCDLSRPTRR